MRSAFTPDRVIARAPRRLVVSAPVAARRPDARPARGLAVITCMDCRVDPEQALGLHLGDAHIIRNAGASLDRSVLRSLRLSQALGTTEIVVLGHTDCRGLEADQSPRVSIAQAVRDLRRSSLPQTDGIRGLLLVLETGEVDVVA